MENSLNQSGSQRPGVQQVLGGLVLFTSGILLGGYVMWSQFKNDSKPETGNSPVLSTVAAESESQDSVLMGGTKSAVIVLSKDVESVMLPTPAVPAVPAVDESGWRSPIVPSVKVEPTDKNIFVPSPIGTKSAPVFEPMDISFEPQSFKSKGKAVRGKQ